jgi:glycosyltransferase involved in cell wall biosynthesis
VARKSPTYKNQLNKTSFQKRRQKRFDSSGTVFIYRKAKSSPPKTVPMLVSLIMPTFNRAHLIEETIKSVIAQTYKSWELIIIDDGSTDKTAIIISKYVHQHSNIHYFTRPSHLPKGANTCRNFGKSLARGEFIKWIDSDDILTPKALALQVDYLKYNPDIDVCISQIGFFHVEGGKQVFSKATWSPKIYAFDPIKDYLFNNIKWQTAAGLWRKQCLPNEPFDVHLKNSQEWIMHFKMLLRNVRFMCTDEVIYFVRYHDERMTSNKTNAKWAEYYYHQCLSRMMALEMLHQHEAYSFQLALRLVMFIAFNYMRVLRYMQLHYMNKGFKFLVKAMGILLGHTIITKYQQKMAPALT